MSANTKSDPESNNPDIQVEPGGRGCDGWSVSISGVSSKNGMLVQVTRYSQDMKEAMREMSEAVEFLSERKVVGIQSLLQETINSALANSTPADTAGQNPSSDEMRSVKVHSAKLLYSPSGAAHLVVKAEPKLMKHGVFAWPEVFKDILGSVEEVQAKYGVAKEIPITDDMRFAWVLYQDGKPQKVVGFKNSP
jgi:hypothetical protein